MEDSLAVPASVDAGPTSTDAPEPPQPEPEPELEPEPAATAEPAAPPARPTDPCAPDGVGTSMYRRLGSDDPAEVKQAAVEIAAHAEDHVLPKCQAEVEHVRAAFGSNDEAVLKVCARLAGRLDGLEPEMRKLLGHASAKLREDAVHYFTYQPYAPAFGDVVALLEDPVWRVRSLTVDFLQHGDKQQLNEQRALLVPVVERGLKSSDGGLIKSMLYVLEITKLTELVPTAIGLLKHPEEKVWIEAAYTLSKVEDERAVDPLIALLFSKQVTTHYHKKVVSVALWRIDKHWGVSRRAPAWLRQLAKLKQEYRQIGYDHRKNVYLREMHMACKARQPPPPEWGMLGGGTADVLGVATLAPHAREEHEKQMERAREEGGSEEEARKALARQQKIAAKLRKAYAAIKQPERKEIAELYLDEYLLADIETLRYCK